MIIDGRDINFHSILAIQEGISVFAAVSSSPKTCQSNRRRNQLENFPKAAEPDMNYDGL